MNCLSVNAVLDLFAEELLTPSRQAAARKHLASCAACAAAAGRLRAPRAPAVALPPGLKDKLRRTLSTPAAAKTAAGPGPAAALAARDGRGALLALSVFSLSLLALHALTPRSPSARPVASDAAPWRLP